ncbi:hypothetical protein F4859DRAFT_201119 [Xylaria cf. heliscus]|nr:hypothetical protein F4859DRAFT_201119 [Xylaria cf. heliscus]
MSHHIPLNHQVDLLSRINDAGEGLEYEDTFTADRPPQYNDSNQVPQTVDQDLTTSQMQSIRDDGYPASCRTDSTSTILLGQAAAGATVTPTRPYIDYHVNYDYSRVDDGSAEPLTEQAIAALNNDFRNGWYNGNVGEWVRGRSQFSPSDPVDLNLSELCSPRTITESTLGSSWTIVSLSTPHLSSQTEYGADVICAAGLQFADIPAFPMGPTLLDEDFI